MKLRFVLTSGALAVLFAATAACYSTRQEARQLDSVSALVFSGHPEGCCATLMRDRTTVWSDKAIAPDYRYQVKPGVYLLTVKRGSETVVRRKIFLGDQQDFEVRVPAMP